MDNIVTVKASDRGKYLITAVDPQNAEPSCAVSIYDGSSKVLLNSFRLQNSQKLLALDISLKEDYILLVYKPTDSEHSIIKIWEILNNTEIVESSLPEKVLQASWSKDGLNFGEFVTLTEANIYFWRLKRDRTLQFHKISIKDLGGKIDTKFCCFSFL